MSYLSVLSGLVIPYKKTALKELRTLQENLSRCYNEQRFIDAEIRIQNRTFKAHKSILAFYSPYFQKAFYGIKNPSSLYIINDLNPEGFDILLRVLYSLKIPDQASTDDLIDAVLAAQLLEMTGIKEKLINYIFYNPKARKLRKPIVENFWSLLQKSHSLKLKELEERLLKFAENHIENVLNHDDFAQADSQLIGLVLDKTTLTVSESYKLERIAHWKDSNFSSVFISWDLTSSELLELEVRDLLAYVNFERLTPKEFYMIISKHYNLIREREALDILMHLVDPTVSSLPEWCSRNDKHNIPVDLSMNKGTLNLKGWLKTDKFKSVEDLHKIGNFNSIRERKKLTTFQSQKDLRKLDDLKTLKKGKEMEFNAEAESCAKTLSQSFNQMLEDGLFTDVTLCAKDKTKIPAHRLILALGSEVFANKLYGATPSNTVRLDETADELKTMLRYFYGTGENIPEKNVHIHLDSILRKLDVALKYKYYPLIRDCCSALASTSMTPYAFWKLLDQKNKLENCSVIIKRLLRYAMTSPKKVFDHEGFYSASGNSLSHILESDFLNMPESDILEYVARWLKRNASTDQKRKELFKHIRFEALNAEQFFTFVTLHDDLLLKEDAFAILTFLFRESKEHRLPEWCYRGPLRSFFYDRFSKIGTDVLLLWKNTHEKGKNLFKCTYTATIAEGIKQSHVQYLELSWRVDPPGNGRKNYNCNITVKHGGSETLTFNVTQVKQYHRIIVPVFFTLNAQNPKMQFHIEVNSVTHHRYYFIQGKKMTFDNVVIEATSNINCISDAIVDNCTSERIKIPKYLLPQNRDTAVPTDKCFKINAEDTS